MKYISFITLAAGLFVATAATSPTAKEHYQAGVENLKQQKFVDAIGSFTEAVSIDPAYADAFYQRAKAKEWLAQQKGYTDNERYADLLQAMRLGKKEALRDVQEGYAGECISGLNYDIPADKVYCLDASSAQLKSIPEKVTQMKNLIQLTVGDNHLKDIHSILANNHTLLFLDARHNQIGNLSADIKNLPYLQELNLRDNQLSTLPVEIGQLKNLQVLNLAGNPMGSSEKKRIRELLPKCRIYFGENESLTKTNSNAKFRPTRKATEMQASKPIPKQF